MTEVRGFTSKDHAIVADMARGLPGSLYHYTSVAAPGRVRDLLERSVIYLRRFSEFNDPFDGAIDASFESTEAERRAYWESARADPDNEPILSDAQIEALIAEPYSAEAQARHSRSLRSALETCGVFCFGSTATDIPMWAYYARGHTGMCVRFNTERLLACCWDRGLGTPLRVTYSAEYPKIWFYRTRLFQRILAMVSTKAKAWEHEGEWRLVNGRQTGNVALADDVIDGVVLGARITDGNEALVRSILRVSGRRVELLKARPMEHEFALEIIPG